MTGCAKEEYDDAYYAKVHTITLLPKETKDPRVVPPQPPYYQLQVARGYLSNSTTQYTSFEFNPLYPSMEHFSPSRRETWYTKTPNGEWGPHVKDVLRVFVEYWPTGENDEGAISFRFVKQQHQKKEFEVLPSSNEFSRKISGLRIYRSVKNVSWKYYIFQQSDGRTVAVKCDLECTGHTTWKDRFRLRYRFPETRLSEMAAIDTTVNILIDSFQPKLIEQGK